MGEQNLLRKLRINELPSETNYIVPSHVVDCGSSVTFEASKYWKKYSNIHSNSIITDIMKGLFVDWLQCSSCGFSRFSFEPFLAIQLSVSSVSTGIMHSVSLSQLLDSFFSKQSTFMYCENCLKETWTNTERKVIRFPASLALIINRVDPIPNNKYSRKMETELIFDKRGLNLQKYLYKDSEEQQMSPDFSGSLYQKEEKSNNASYSLVSITCHFGAPHNGLYYTACANIDDFIWRIFAPGAVFEMTPSRKVFQRINSDVYMLWYQLSSFDSFEIGQSEDMDDLAMDGSEPSSIIQMAALHKFLLPEMTSEMSSEDIANNLMIQMNDIFKKPALSLEKNAAEAFEQMRSFMIEKEDHSKSKEAPKPQQFSSQTRTNQRKEDEEENKHIDDVVAGVIHGIVRKENHPVKNFPLSFGMDASLKEVGARKKRVNFILEDESQKQEDSQPRSHKEVSIGEKKREKLSSQKW